MISRRALLVVALLAGAIAGVSYYAAAQRVTVVIVARDVAVARPLSADDVAEVAMPADIVPVGAMGDRSRVVGRFPRVPMWRGQLLLEPSLADDAVTFRGGPGIASWMRAIALPVNASQAVGGALTPGERVDVLAVPIAGRAPAGRTAEIVASGVLVLDVRSEDGEAYDRPDKSPAPYSLERIGSVIIAIPAADEIRIADRIATSTFVIALSGSRA